MRWLTSIPLCLLLCLPATAQKKGLFGTAMANVQYAGSTGLVSGGISTVSHSGKFEAGIQYGYTPHKAGGELHSLTLRFVYNPFKLIRGPWVLEPLLAGVFVSQHFGPNLSVLWDSYYPRGYYWWTKGLRQHLSLAMQAGYKTNRWRHIDRVSVYIETNTNDLYLYSYFANLRSLRWHDIFFLGAGIKTYLK